MDKRLKAIPKSLGNSPPTGSHVNLSHKQLANLAEQPEWVKPYLAALVTKKLKTTKVLGSKCLVCDCAGPRLYFSVKKNKVHFGYVCRLCRRPFCNRKILNALEDKVKPDPKVQLPQIPVPTKIVANSPHTYEVLRKMEKLGNLVFTPKEFERFVVGFPIEPQSPVPQVPVPEKSSGTPIGTILPHHDVPLEDIDEEWNDRIKMSCSGWRYPIDEPQVPPKKYTWVGEEDLGQDVSLPELIDFFDKPMMPPWTKEPDTPPTVSKTPSSESDSESSSSSQLEITPLLANYTPDLNGSCFENSFLLPNCAPFLNSPPQDPRIVTIPHSQAAIKKQAKAEKARKRELDKQKKKITRTYVVKNPMSSKPLEVGVVAPQVLPTSDVRPLSHTWKRNVSSYSIMAFLILVVFVVIQLTHIGLLLFCLPLAHVLHSKLKKEVPKWVWCSVGLEKDEITPTCRCTSIRILVRWKLISLIVAILTFYSLCFGITYILHMQYYYLWLEISEESMIVFEILEFCHMWVMFGYCIWCGVHTSIYKKQCFDCAMRHACRICHADPEHAAFIYSQMFVKGKDVLKMRENINRGYQWFSEKHKDNKDDPDWEMNRARSLRDALLAAQTVARIDNDWALELKPYLDELHQAARFASTGELPDGYAERLPKWSDKFRKLFSAADSSHFNSLPLK